MNKFIFQVVIEKDNEVYTKINHLPNELMPTLVA